MRPFKMLREFEDIPVQFVGVHVLHWKPEWGEPEVAFIEAEEWDSVLEALEQVGPAIDSLMAEICGEHATNWRLVNDTLCRVEDAIAKAKGKS